MWSLFSHLLPSLIKSGSSWWSPQWPWLCVTSEAKRWAEEEINFKHFPQLSSHWWITVSKASDWSILITWPEYWPLIGYFANIHRMQGLWTNWVLMKLCIELRISQLILSRDLTFPASDWLFKEARGFWLAESHFVEACLTSYATGHVQYRP